jgi:hypothetical protein
MLVAGWQLRKYCWATDIVIFGSPAGNSCKIVVFSPDYLITFTSTCAINVKHN